MTKREMDLNIRTLEEVIEKCDFKDTAEVFALTLRELIETYKLDEISGYDYNHYMNLADKMLKESKCSCTKTKH